MVSISSEFQQNIHQIYLFVSVANEKHFRGVQAPGIGVTEVGRYANGREPPSKKMFIASHYLIVTTGVQ